MSAVKIVSRDGVDVLFEYTCDSNSLKCTLEEAIKNGADLSGADLSGTNLSGADLSGTDLSGTNLRRADLSGTNLDFSAWPLSCGSLDAVVDAGIAMQIAYHFCRLDCDDPGYLEARQALIGFASGFHRADECGRLK